jgi:pyrroline-5-carboxylate reductase
MELVIVGGGKMGEALLAGLVAAKWAEPEELAVVEPVVERRAELAARHPGVTVSADPVAADGAVLATKPIDVPAVCATLTSKRVLSIAAGVTIATIEAALGRPAAVVRAMPNTAAVVGAGAAAIAGGTHAGNDDLAWAEGILGAVGEVQRVPEKLLDAVTGLSGSGPAYVFLVAEALIEGGVMAGLPRSVSEALAVQTILGAARLLVETGEGPEALRAAVTSPGGTTAAGLRELERAGVRSALIEAVLAATRRSAELGG